MTRPPQYTEKRKNENMKHETVKLPHGYTAEIHIDESPENPFEAWDCEPPIAVLNWERYHAKLDNYGGDELNLEILLALIPAPLWESREGKRAILAALPFDMADLRDTMRDGWGGKLDFSDAIHALAETLTPSGWGEWVEYFGTMKAVAAVAGIPCHYTQSNGYSQGDSALVFVAALPAWVGKVGAPAEHHAEQCKHAADLWSAWAWGDVYGVAEILRPDGEEAPYGSCWGFYGSDHEQSGLMEHCRNAVDCDMAAQEREAARAHDAACRDIETAA
jgi:hypothetical protein